jgi:hypothetical protein
MTKIILDNMETNYSNQDSYYRAEKRVKEIKGFYTHLTIYCIIIPILIFVNLKFEPSFHWFWFSLVGWGMGLLCHWLAIFGFRLLGFGKNWEEKKIQEFMNETK